ncbi:MAG: hypothetical protein J1E34_05625 [Oscillospiraceae bacterium]|nr:hypothetical protein [Oscillospiraceae bacterium]
MENYLIEHLTDLSAKTENQSIYTFSDFLSEDEQAKLLERKKELALFTFFGGTEGTERNMVRFGSEDILGYTLPFPIVCIFAEPLNKKFADTLTHRDFLGSLMSLGIERSAIGDIIVKNNSAYIFCTEKIAPHLLDNLYKIKHTDIKCSVCENIPSENLFETQSLRLTVSSLRADCVTAAAAHLSRGKADELFREKRVFINGASCEKTDAVMKIGDKLSLRGIGKFRLTNISGTSKKGKTILEIEKYI